MAIRRGSRVVLAVVTPLLVCAACAGPTRLRVLRFFFDGVPVPGSTPDVPKAAVPDVRASPMPPDVTAGTGARASAHPPYRDNRCGSCHDRDSGGLFKPVAAGLCATCHADVPGDARFVHGPVAVGDCLFCHHHHTAPYPKLLLQPTTALCLSCHDRDDLTNGPHHGDLESETCVACHDPHGGESRLFLTRAAP